MEPRTEQGKTGDSGTSAVPLIVNGMPFRPRKTVNIWKILGFAGISVVPDILLIAAIPLAVRSILKYFDSKRWLPDQ
jgi:hypothetical protein